MESCSWSKFKLKYLTSLNFSDSDCIDSQNNYKHEVMKWLTPWTVLMTWPPPTSLLPQTMKKIKTKCILLIDKRTAASLVVWAHKRTARKVGMWGHLHETSVYTDSILTCVQNCWRIHKCFLNSKIFVGLNKPGVVKTICKSYHRIISLAQLSF